MACVTIQGVQGWALNRELNLTTDVPAGKIPQALFDNMINVVCRNRRQLVLDFGTSAAKQAADLSNTIKQLIELEVAHHLKLFLMASSKTPEGQGVLGPLTAASFSRAGTSGSKSVGVAAFGAVDLLERTWARTAYGQLWYQLWIALPPGLTTTSAVGGCGPAGGVCGGAVSL